MSETYPIIKENKNSYFFTTKNDIEYELILRASGILYNDNNGQQKNVIELALNCEHNIVSKDYKTLKTVIAFCNNVASKFDAIYLQMHNEPEGFDNNTKRRGASRLKLWSRLIKNNFKDYLFLTNQILDPDKEKDILCIVVKKDSINYKQIVTNFYRFKYEEK